MDRQEDLDAARELVRRRLEEAEAEYQRARSEDYVTRLVRESAIVEAHRAGLSSREISDLVGDIGQANVVRTRRRAANRPDIPDGLLSPVDALRLSGMTPSDFITWVRSGRLHPVELPGGVRAFRTQEIEHLQAGA